MKVHEEGLVLRRHSGQGVHGGRALREWVKAEKVTKKAGLTPITA